MMSDGAVCHECACPLRPGEEIYCDGCLLRMMRTSRAQQQEVNALAAQLRQYHIEDLLRDPDPIMAEMERHRSACIERTLAA